MVEDLPGWIAEEERIRRQARKALSDRFEPEIDKVKRRLIQIETEIVAAKMWDGMLPDLLGERRRLISMLERLENPAVEK
jgi:Mg2+ and Co2+ transporter CorA